MADAEYVLVKHVRFPIPYDQDLGRYQTELDAQNALNAILLNKQWFTTYAIEKRVAGG